MAAQLHAGLEYSLTGSQVGGSTPRLLGGERFDSRSALDRAAGLESLHMAAVWRTVVWERSLPAVRFEAEAAKQTSAVENVPAIYRVALPDG